MENKLTSGKITIVKNSPEYWEFIRTVRNHPQTKKGFVQQKYISKKEHLKYMQKYGDHYFICLYEGMPAGFAGSVNDDIRVATHPSYLRKGIAKILIKHIVSVYPTSVAKVKIKNKASLKLFESCGFTKRFYLLDFSKENDET